MTEERNTRNEWDTFHILRWLPLGRMQSKRLCGRQATPWLCATQLLPPGFVHSSVLHLSYRVLLQDTEIGKELEENYLKIIPKNAIFWCEHAAFVFFNHRPLSGGEGGRKTLGWGFPVAFKHLILSQSVAVCGSLCETLVVESTSL